MKQLMTICDKFINNLEDTVREYEHVHQNFK